MTRHPTLVIMLWTTALVVADDLARQRGWW